MMKLLLQELLRRNRWLTVAALAHFCLLALLILLVMLDDHQITGVNRWFKPAKFAASIGLYLLTMAWLLAELQRPRWMLAALSAVMLCSMAGEQLLITMQAFRGVTSHYNSDTAFNATVFRLMGAGIASNSIAAAVTLVLFSMHATRGREAYVWGIRFGLVLFLLGSVQGIAMLEHAGHTIGAHDGTPGLPLTGWSRIAGDLRIAHFVGIHGIPLLPAVGLGLDHLRLRHRVGLIAAFAIAYASLGVLAHADAMGGRPLIQGGAAETARTVSMSKCITSSRVPSFVYSATAGSSP